MAKEAAVFKDGKFLRLETVWQGMPSAGRTEPSRQQHTTATDFRLTKGDSGYMRYLNPIQLEHNLTA